MTGRPDRGREGLHAGHGYHRDLDLLAGPLAKFSVPYGKGTEISHAGTARPGSSLEPTLRYDPKKDQILSLVTGAVYKDDGKGEFANTNNPRDTLLPGWRTYIGGSNFSSLVRNQQVRSPFLNVLWWTFVFAAGTVLLSFSIGLFLAIALDKRGCASSGCTARSSSSRGRSRASSRCSSGPACSMTPSAP